MYRSNAGKNNSADDHKKNNHCIADLFPFLFSRERLEDHLQMERLVRRVSRMQDYNLELSRLLPENGTTLGSQVQLEGNLRRMPRMRGPL